MSDGTPPKLSFLSAVRNSGNSVLSAAVGNPVVGLLSAVGKITGPGGLGPGVVGGLGNQPVRQPQITGSLDTPKKLQAYLNLCPRELTEIELHNAKITTKSLQGIRFPPGLKELNLEQNQITSLEGVHFPIGLTELILMQNQIGTLSGAKFPRGLKRLDLSSNKIWTLSGTEFPPTLEDLDLEDNPLRDLGTYYTQMINPNKYVIEYLKRNFTQLYFRDLYDHHKASKIAEKSALKTARQSQKAVLKAARQSQNAELKTARQFQKAELHKMTDLSQQSMRIQMHAVTSFLREGMNTRAQQHAEQLLRDKQEKPTTYEQSLFYAQLNEKTYPVPMIEEMSIQDVLDYLNEHYYISVLHNCGGMHLHKPGAGKLESGRTLKECGVVSEDVLHIQCGSQKGGFARSKKHNKRSNKSKSKKNGHKRK